MAKGDDIQERLLHLGVGVMTLCDELPPTNAGKHISGQLLRCGTSAAPNYAEARGAESASDFVRKLGVVLKELNETEMWLEMVRIRGILADERRGNERRSSWELAMKLRMGNEELTHILNSQFPLPAGRQAFPILRCSGEPLCTATLERVVEVQIRQF